MGSTHKSLMMMMMIDRSQGHVVFNNSKIELNREMHNMKMSLTLLLCVKNINLLLLPLLHEMYFLYYK
jgi:hypothetical protein